MGKIAWYICKRGRKKVDAISNFWENCMILKNFSLGK
jgi:hypothetical protein